MSLLPLFNVPGRTTAVLGVLVGLICLTSCGRPAPSDAVKAQVHRTFVDYILAVQRADTNLLGQVMTPSFLANHGGLDGWARRLAEDKQKHQGLSLGEVRIVPHSSSTNVVFTQFTLQRADGKVETMEDSGVWWMLTRNAGGDWRLDEVIQEFDQRDLSEQR
jgi:hypothetical protein